MTDRSEIISASRSTASSSPWHELHTFDFRGAIRFYSSAFGVEPVAMPGAPSFEMSTWGDGTTPTAGIYAGTDWRG